LAEVGADLEREGFEYWLFGGWAVDFYVGAITREHGDIDLAVWAHDARAIEELLRARGWRHKPKPEEDGGTGYEQDAVRVELTFLASDDNARIFVAFRNQNILWSEQPFGNKKLKLSGVSARLVPLALLKNDKSKARDDPDAATKDHDDSEALSHVAS
jgi:hypothetical protein